MNEDRLTGTAKNLGGQLEEGYGRATGDLRSQAEGRARQAEGAIQDLYGQAKDAAGSAAQSVREHAREAEDFVCTMIEERPYTTAAVALGIGFLIGRFGRRDND